MPSSLPQINVRLTPEGMVQLQRLADRLAERDGRPASSSDVVRYGLTLAARELGLDPAPAPGPQGRRRRPEKNS